MLSEPGRDGLNRLPTCERREKKRSMCLGAAFGVYSESCPCQGQGVLKHLAQVSVQGVGGVVAGGFQFLLKQLPSLGQQESPGARQPAVFLPERPPVPVNVPGRGRNESMMLRQFLGCSRRKGQ